MARVIIPGEILRRISRHQGLAKNLAAFIEACRENKTPPRIYKRSGIAADGRKFPPYLELNLHHHHLHANGDPLLITQHVDDCIYVIGLARHADYFHGDKMQWLKEHAHQIEWTGLEWLRESVLNHEP